MNDGIPGCFGCATPFTNLQIWASHALHGHPLVTAFMTSAYGWPMVETLHFLGLTLLVGTIGAFDLRVLGIARRIPIAALHRMAPWGIAGYAVNVITGFMFLMTLPDLYLYQWPFLLKMALMAAAGVNAVMFRVAVMPRIEALGPGDSAPAAAKVMCAVSLCLWVGVMFAGRLLAFYKPVFTIPPP